MKYVIKLPPEQLNDRSGGNFIINMQTLVHVKIQLCMILLEQKTDVLYWPRLHVDTQPTIYKYGFWCYKDSIIFDFPQFGISRHQLLCPHFIESNLIQQVSTHFLDAHHRTQAKRLM